MKMRQAARLLSDSSLSVSDIAERLGYTNAGNFRRIFKKYFRTTPIEFRKGTGHADASEAFANMDFR